MKKVIAVIFIFTSILAFGIDFGANVLNQTGLSYTKSDNKTDFIQNDITGLWISADIAEFLNIYVKGSYAFSYSYLNPPKKPNFFDLDTFTVNNIGNVPLIVKAGRFRASDFSGYVFKNKVDGISALVNIPLLNANAVLGYNGLLFKESSSVVMTEDDILDLSDSNKLFSSPRIIGGINILFPELFLKQDLNASFWTQFDLRPYLQSGAKGYFSQYYGLGLSGNVIGSLYYNSSFYFETGSSYSLTVGYSYIFSYMGNAQLSYYMEELLSSRVKLNFFYSSGDKDYTASFYNGNTAGFSTMFMPISTSVFAKVFSPQPGNIFSIKADYSIKPLSFLKVKMLKNIQTVVSALSFFRSTTGAISESGINSDSASLYLGTEVDAAVNANLFSDLSIFLSGGVFFPNNVSGGAFSNMSRDIEIKADLGVFFEL